MPSLPARPVGPRPARPVPRAAAPALGRAPLVLRAEAAAPAAPAARATAAPVPAVAAAPAADKWAPVKAVVSRILKGAAVAGLALALVFGSPAPAEAARSAGRVGGFAGDSGGGGSAASSSRSYGGGSSSYGGGGGGYGGGYGGGSSYSRSYGGGGVYVAPPPAYGNGYISSYSVIPPLIAPPVMVSPYASPAVAVAAPAASGAFDAVLLAAVAFIALSTVSTALGPSRAGGLLAGDDDGGAGGLAVTKVQVGLLAVARELKGQLDAIAEAADTSSNEGLQALLNQAVLALLRNPQYAAYASGARTDAASTRDLERAFNAASLAERSKFSEETLVNVRGGGGPRRAALRPRDAAAAAAQPDELVVVTLLVASKGPLALPKKIDSLDSLRTALRALGGLPAEQVLGVEVIWTPQAEDDSYSRDELIADYPAMRNL
ncbi:hypothetical protein Rsub_10132 [Raphidocelis subcapitata]|uniref:DUF1517 domain-containing protein n=1 Tax=Raphidocelis subcapitata TaxID=307507 RepID=A0A2V0PB86_9CHLO|nr:hypothetical protein Rsub_10132 [Raphidocelis subcapitata]|eukprot:GBF97121.1 hypothetical protein Rsub_10132 [Raphidocelis subcapitata]